MGCDIHVWIQKKRTAEGHYWDWSGEMSWDRSYRLFNRMAGVRSNKDSPPPIVAPRGWPADSKPNGYDDPDFHTASWLALYEVLRLAAEFPGDISAAAAAMLSLRESGHDVRLVFAFDN